MILRSFPFRATALFLLLFALAAAPAKAAKKEPRERTWMMNFGADTLGQAPELSQVASGTWVVLEDSSAAPPADSGAAHPRLLRQSDGDESEGSRSIRFPKPSFRNGEVSVRFRIRSGSLDPSVGILFLLDAKGKNGYLVRVCGAEDDLRTHYILNGRRRDLKFVPLKSPPPGEWHTLTVRRKGIRIFVAYDGETRMELREERFTQGTVGLWTEDDTVADFADLKVTVR